MKLQINGHMAPFGVGYNGDDLDETQLNGRVHSKLQCEAIVKDGYVEGDAQGDWGSHQLRGVRTGENGEKLIFSYRGAQFILQKHSEAKDLYCGFFHSFDSGSGSCRFKIKLDSEHLPQNVGI